MKGVLKRFSGACEVAGSHLETDEAGGDGWRADDERSLGLYNKDEVVRDQDAGAAAAHM